MQIKQDNTKLHEKIIGIINNPPSSNCDYFIEFTKNPLCFTEGIRAIIEAADSLWAIKEIVKAQRTNSFSPAQAWTLYSYSSSGTPMLKGYNIGIELISQKYCAGFLSKPFLNTKPIVSKKYSDKYFPISGEVWFWIVDGLIMLPAEYERMAKKQTA